MMSQVLSLLASLTNDDFAHQAAGDGLLDDAFDDGGGVAFFVVDGDEDGEGFEDGLDGGLEV